MRKLSDYCPECDMLWEYCECSCGECGEEWMFCDCGKDWGEEY